MKFKGTIIITDPCYIMRAEHHGTTPITDDDWEACDCGQNMEVLGIKHYICERTIYENYRCVQSSGRTGFIFVRYADDECRYGSCSRQQNEKYSDRQKLFEYCK